MIFNSDKQMKNRHIAFSALVAALFPALASAQDFNPTVEVTNVYDVTMVDALKPAMKMAVPDSLLKFDLDFDYSVLSSPYQGGYDFSPYFLQMKPAPDADRGRKFYLRAGAGYPLDPKLDFVWSPVLSRPGVNVDVHGNLDSYFGRYHATALLSPAGEDGVYRIGRLKRSSANKTDSCYVGRDVKATAGAGFRKQWENTALRLGLDYEGIYTSDRFLDDSYNAVVADAYFSRNDDGSPHFQYSVGINYRFGADKLDYGRADVVTEPGSDNPITLTSSEFSLYGTLGKVYDGNHRVMADVRYSLSQLGGIFQGEQYEQSGMLTLVPKYVYGNGRLNLSAGVRLDIPAKDYRTYCGVALHQRRGQYAYPDVHFDYQLVYGSLDLYASATGGLRNYGFSELKNRRYFLNAACNFAGIPFLDYESVRIDLALGLRGNMGGVFRYDLSAGFLSGAGMLTDMLSTGHMTPFTYEGFINQDRNIFHADLSLKLDTESVLVDGYIGYRSSDHVKNERLGFEDSPLFWNFRFRYDWKDRIFAGVHCDGSLARRGYGYLDGVPAAMRLPAWCDLGFDAEFALARKFSLWASAGNLLCSTLLKSPDHARKGMNITAGICLNF